MEAIVNPAPGQVTTAVQTPAGTTNSEQPVKTSETQPESTASEDFSAFLMKSLGRTGQEKVNEEELFSSLISQRLAKESEEASDFYEEQVKALSTSMARSDGYILIEDVAKAALKETVGAGIITTEIAERINAEAFRGAQLDNNLLALWDGRGTTSALATMDEAMFKVKALLDQIEAGTLTLDARSLDTPSNTGLTPGLPPAGVGQGSKVSLSEQAEGDEHVERATEGEEAEGTEEAEHSEAVEEGTSEKQVRFTWKHVARDGNLAVLLPTRLNGKIDGVSLFDENGNLIEKGDYSKQTGDRRAVYRFDEPGSAYGKNVDAVVYLENGQTLTYLVQNGGKRTYVPQDDYLMRSVADLEAAMSAKRDASAPAGDTTSAVTPPEATSTAAAAPASKPGSSSPSSDSNSSGGSSSSGSESGSSDQAASAGSSSGSSDSGSGDSNTGSDSGSSSNDSSGSSDSSDSGDSSKDSPSA